MSAITLLSDITTGSRIFRVLAASLSRGFGFRLNDLLTAKTNFCSCHSVLSIDSNIIAYNQADGSGGALTVGSSPPLDNHVVKPEFTKTLILPTMT